MTEADRVVFRNPLTGALLVVDTAGAERIERDLGPMWARETKEAK